MERYVDFGEIPDLDNKIGFVYWKNFQHVADSLTLIDQYIRISHFCQLKVPRYRYANTAISIVGKPPTEYIDMASVIHIKWWQDGMFLQSSFANTQSYPFTKVTVLEDTGSVYMPNMIRLYKAREGESFIFFDDIIRTIIMYRREQMFAMLITMKAPQDNALQRAKRHTLWEPQLLRLIGQII